jgi:peptidoglycan DL-endopeptidase LytF
MSRRDTIIIALLVNAGLLAFLFMLAVNNDEEVILEQPEMTGASVDAGVRQAPPMRPASVTLPEKSLNDEVDSFLKELAMEEPNQPVVIDDESYVELRREEPVPVAAKPVAPREIKSGDDSRFVEVTVKRGDALEKIARSNGTTIEAIKKANDLTTSKLSIGQVLRVPVSSKGPAETTEKAKPVQTATQVQSKEPPKKVIASADPQYYTIKSGDNPWKIAKQYNVKFEDLLKMNNLDEERARNLKIGDKVRVK